MSTAAQIRDAASPIADALAAVQDRGLRLRPVDILISYTRTGCVVRVADRSANHRAVVEAEFRRAFVAAGWDVTTRQAAFTPGGGLSMQHPLTTSNAV
ncbi:hypothetical protein ACH4GK_17970 [Streptomyces rimosus]|uniref:hypothetical protein n=1 Tax=Streptomyces rimosus TaxID=1927 RepID=UPI00131C33CE|nr:hypothetical protein [Streptomyces rimosus]